MSYLKYLLINVQAKLIVLIFTIKTPIANEVNGEKMNRGKMNIGAENQGYIPVIAAP